jgi:integrase
VLLQRSRRPAERREHWRWPAGRDERITNRRAWTLGLAALPDSRRPRNQVLADDDIRRIVAACWEQHAALGLLVEVLAVTGARTSQAARLCVGDVQADRLVMPRSAKGRGQKRIDRRPVPVSATLIAKLRAAAGTRTQDATLLLRPDGQPWQSCDVGWRFAKAVVAAGLPKATPYALRHSSITRALLRGVPVRVVADSHDTSVMMLEATYAHLISDHAEEMVRGALLDLDGPPPAGNVVPMPPGRRA